MHDSRAAERRSVALCSEGLVRQENVPVSDAGQWQCLEICFRKEVYEKFLELTKMPSVKTDAVQSDSLISTFFSNEEYRFVEAYDSRMPRYFPLVSASTAISLMRGRLTPSTVASELQEQIELSKPDWQKWTQLRHVKCKKPSAKRSFAQR